MGCSSQIGCLGPKPRQRQVYVDLIQTIHLEVSRMSIPPETDIYQQISARLMKKGLIKKLIDNLVSHKTHIYDCFSQNFEIVSQTSLKLVRIAGLVITDKIMAELQKGHRKVNNNEQQQVMKSTNGSFSHVQFRTSSGQGLIKHSALQSFTVSMQQDHRVDLLFFKFVLFLLQNEESVQNYILMSIQSFVSGKSQKLNCKIEILRLFEILIDNIQSGVLVESSSKTYAVVLKQLKDNLKDQPVDQESIIFFLGVWVDQEKHHEKEQSMQIINYQAILQLYFSRYIGEYQILFRSLVKVIDERGFDQNKIGHLDAFFLRIVKQQDIYLAFMKGIFIYLLKYLSVQQTLPHGKSLSITSQNVTRSFFKNIGCQQTKLHAFQLLRKWISNHNVEIDDFITYNSSIFYSSYLTNILNSSSNHLIVQIKQQFSVTVQLLNNNSALIIINGLLEDIRDQQTMDHTRIVMVDMVDSVLSQRPVLTEANNILAINFIIPLQISYSMQTKIGIFGLLDRMFKHIKPETVMKSDEMNQTFMNRVGLLLYSFYQNIVDSNHYLKKDVELVKKSLGHRKSLQSQEQDKFKFILLVKYKFTNQVLGLLKNMLHNYLYIFVLPFIESINNALSKIILKSSFEQHCAFFFLLCIIQQTLFSVSKRQMVSQQLIKINHKLEEGSVSLTIKQDIIESVECILKKKYLGCQIKETQGIQGENESQDLLVQNLIKINAARILIVRQFSMLGKSQYWQMMEVLKDYFRPVYKSRLNDQSIEASNQHRLFYRCSSVNVSLDELNHEKTSNREEGEESFMDILEKINES